VNRSIPLQVQLFSDATLITDTNIAGAAPVVNVTYSASTGPAVDVTNQLDPVGQSSEGNEFRYNPAAGHWIIVSRRDGDPFTGLATADLVIVKKSGKILGIQTTPTPPAPVGVVLTLVAEQV
jgi:hypothetical protein